MLPFIRFPPDAFSPRSEHSCLFGHRHFLPQAKHGTLVKGQTRVIFPALLPLGLSMIHLRGGLPSKFDSTPTPTADRPLAAQKLVSMESPHLSLCWAKVELGDPVESNGCICNSINDSNVACHSIRGKQVEVGDVKAFLWWVIDSTVDESSKPRATITQVASSLDSILVELFQILRKVLQHVARSFSCTWLAGHGFGIRHSFLEQAGCLFLPS